MNVVRRGQIAGLAAAVLFGCSAPLISTLTGAGSALSIAALLYAGAALALLALRALKGRSQTEAPVQRQDWPALAGLTLLGGVVGPVALVLGLARMPAASSSLLLNLESVFTLAIAVAVGREHLGRRGAASAALTLAGAVVLSGGSLSGASWLGTALIALATLAWGIDNNLSQHLSLRDPIQIATLKAAGASLPMLGLAVLLGHRFPSLPLSLGLLAIGALGYGISIWLDLLALRDLGAAREAVMFSTAPFVGALFSLLVLGDKLTPSLGLAAALMAAVWPCCCANSTAIGITTNPCAMPIATAMTRITPIPTTITPTVRKISAMGWPMALSGMPTTTATTRRPMPTPM